jgi:hypothetical protein
MRLPGRSQRAKEAMRIFRFSTASLGLRGVRPRLLASGRSSGLCARGSMVILLHVSHIKFSPDGETSSAPSSQTGQGSPGLAVGDSVR